VQSLVYIFIALAGLGVAAGSYFGLTFTPIESLVLAAAFVAVSIILLERTLRRRAEARLERAIEELSRLLSTDAQAGAVLGQRINALTDIDADRRLEVVEADLSVLGTVVRQVAEAVADLEEARKRQVRREAIAAAAPTPPVAANTSVPATVVPVSSPGATVTIAPPPSPVIQPTVLKLAEPPPPAAEAGQLVEAGPVIPLETLRQAIDDNRLIFHLQPIITLPQRRVYAYDLLPRLMLDEGELADAPDFMPRKGGESVVRRIERMALEDAIAIARRSRTSGTPAVLHVPLSRASLTDADFIDKFVTTLDANRAIAGALGLKIADADWQAMPLSERAALAAFVKKGVGLSLSGLKSLRQDFGDLAADGVRSVRVNATRFLSSPTEFSDFHATDIVKFLGRFSIDLIATGVNTEDQVLTLLEDGIGYVQGPHVAGPGPARADLVLERPTMITAPARVQA